MLKLKQKHQQLIDRVGEIEAVKKLHGFYDRSLRKTNKVDPEKFKDQVSQIINHLNSVTGLSYRVSSVETKALIRARLNEGFTVEDFRKVNEIKSKKWLDNDNRIYLRPSTLYRASKFEGYLQEWQIEKNEVKAKEQKKKNDKLMKQIKKEDEGKIDPIFQQILDKKRIS